MNRLLYFLIILVSFNSNLFASAENILGVWETTDQYGYGYMEIESEEKGKIIFYSSSWKSEFIEVELTDLKETDDGFDLNMKLLDGESAKISGTASYKHDMLCLKVSSPKEPNLMCFMRPEKVDFFREKAIKENTETL